MLLYAVITPFWSFVLSSSFKDFLRIVGKNGGSASSVNDQLNALGNHLGSHLLQLNYYGDNTKNDSKYFVILKK